MTAPTRSAAVFSASYIGDLALATPTFDIFARRAGGALCLAIGLGARSSRRVREGWTPLPAARADQPRSPTLNDSGVSAGFPRAPGRGAPPPGAGPSRQEQDTEEPRQQPLESSAPEPGSMYRRSIMF